MCLLLFLHRCLQEYFSCLTHVDIIAVVIDIRPTVSRQSRTRPGTTQFAEAFLTDASIYPSCISFTVWHDALLRYPIFSEEFQTPFLLKGTGLKPNNYRGMLLD